MTDVPWYEAGLQFECQRCGGCCAGSPGQVWITEDELVEIAAFLDMDSDTFRDRYTEAVEGRGRCLKERGNFDCIFYNRRQGCVIYPYRPRQCRTWPFWKWNLETPDRWRYTAMDCPGIGKGRHYTLKEIEAFSADDGLV